MAHKSFLKSFLKSYPTVTVAIPTYNEAVNIAQVIQGFLVTQYPNLVQVLVADGGSTDATCTIVQAIAEQDDRVKLLHNPLKLQAAGLNLALQAATGDIFLRADAHTEYALDYIESCVQALLDSEALNVGGAQRFIAKSPFQAGIALAAKSLLGSGGAKYRNPNYDGYAETVYLGCFWRNVLLQLSGYNIATTANEDSELNLRLQLYVFDPTQATNQAAELNQRLLYKNLKAIYVSSQIRAWYYPRKTWRSLCLQYFKYGRGRYLTATKHISQLQLRGKLPFSVVSVAILGSLVDIAYPALNLPLQEIVLAGLLLPFVEAARMTLQSRKTFRQEIWRGDKMPSYWSRWFFCSVALLTMPIAHCSGYAYQLLRRKIFGVNGW